MLRAVQPSQLTKRLLLPAQRTYRPRSLRHGSTNSHSSLEYDPSLYERPEGFGNSLFILGGASIVGLACYQTFSSDPSGQSSSGGTDLIAEAEDDQKPWLTRYLAYHFAWDPIEYKKINDHNMAVVFEAADTAHFKASIEKPAIRRLRNAGCFEIASPYGLIPGTGTDLSDLKIRSYQEDCRAPEPPTQDESDETKS